MFVKNYRSITLLTILLVGCGGGGGSSSTDTEGIDETVVMSSHTDNTEAIISPSSQNLIDEPKEEEALITIEDSEENVTNIVDTTTDNTNSMKEIVDNTGRAVNKPFQEYSVILFSDQSLESKSTISQSTKAVYGKIDGASTKSLLKINSNYKNIDIVVKVYKNSKLVGSSEPISIGEEVAINFGEINIKRK